MCDYKPGSYPQEWWGQRLRTFAKDGVLVHNRAVGGISSKTFIDSGRWQKVLDDIKPGDYAIMAFGHNDATKSKPQRYCNKEDYAKNMSLFVDGIRGKGATPVLATSIIHIGGVREVEWGMGNGEWGMGNGEWTMENGVRFVQMRRDSGHTLPRRASSRRRRTCRSSTSTNATTTG